MEIPKRTISRRAEAIAVVFLVACLGALGLHAATQTTNFAPIAATVGNARLLSLALVQYAQDSDERLPPAQTVAAFQTAMRPYVPDPAVFVSRVTGQPFIPNPAISGKVLSAFTRPDTTIVFQDTAAKATVAFLDGHVERGGVDVDNVQSSSHHNAAALALGVLQYAEDYDERYPPMKTQAEFQTALLPYVHRKRYFTDPDNNKQFVPNPAVSGVSEASIDDPSGTVLFQSALPYKNGVPTVAYADGHVTPLPPISTKSLGVRDASNLKRIGLAVIQYAQDYDEVLPETTDYPTFVSLLQPYAKTADIFTSPGTGLPYILNPALSSIHLADITDPSNTEMARDAQLNPDGTFNRLQADGHVRQDFYLVPRALAVDADDRTHLFWPQANNTAAVWALLPGGITKYTDTLSSVGRFNNINTPLAFGVGADGQTRILWRNEYLVDIFSVPVTGAITLDTIGADGSLDNSTQFGPYDGWTALFLTTGADNSSRLLWQRYDGTTALWTLSPEGNYLGSVSVPKLTGGTPVGLALGTDGLTRLLWKTATGNAKLWTVSASGQVVRSFGIPSPPGETLTALGLGADGASRLLWSDSRDHAAVLTLTENGGFVGYVTFTLPGGGTAAQIAAGKAGDLRVLWEAADGSGQLQTLSAKGKPSSVQSLTPYL